MEVDREPALRVRDLRARYDGPEVLHGIDIEVAEGEVAVVLGPNGAGKSTLLRAIMGMTPGASGQVRLRGRDVSGLPPFRRAAAGLGFVPETRGVFGGLTVKENLHLNLGRKPDLGEVFEVFPILAERLDQRAGTLSGGQQQMLGIARIVLRNPAIILIDEPSLGLAPTLVERVFDALRVLVGQGKTVLLAEQNAAVALALADTGYVIERGQLVVQGVASELRNDEQIVRAYLGG